VGLSLPWAATTRGVISVVGLFGYFHYFRKGVISPLSGDTYGCPDTTCLGVRTEKDLAMRKL
jgi:hypothetical protein